MSSIASPADGVGARTAPRDDRILPEVHWIAGAVTVVLLVAAAILYVWPDRTTQLFAWTVEPTMSALLMGAGYGAGAYFFARLFLGPRWHWFGIYLPAIATFTWVLAFSTILYWDRFNHDHVAFYAWVVLYFTTPVLVPLLWWRNRRTDPGTPDPEDVEVPRPIRIAAGMAGVGLLGMALVMVAFPSVVMPLWPWPLTEPSCRVIGGWIAAPGVCDVLFAFERRWSAWRIIVQHQAIAVALILLAVVRAWGEFDPANPVTWLYVGGMAGFLVAMLALLLVMDARRSRAAVPAPAAR
ncbi:MAG TPA: hypothetical protein VM536_15310 [Chloroflexia bacterium]|nr:hypothetical protein [Chloroflexia bacterium]